MTDCAWRSASVLLAVTEYSLSHTAARIDATSRGMRIASVPELDEETFAAALPVDYSALARSAGAIAEALTRARNCRLASSAGTELVLDVEGRVAVADDGNLQQSGAFGNLPAGEAYIAPIATFGNGTIVIDGPLTGYGVLARPLRVQLEAGRLVSGQGEASDWPLETLDADDEDGRLIAEVGIGVNPSARLTGNSILDEKSLGTAHVAFGGNTGFGGANAASVHIDGITREPAIELDGVPLSLGDGPTAGRPKAETNASRP